MDKLVHLGAKVGGQGAFVSGDLPLAELALTKIVGMYERAELTQKAAAELVGIRLEDFVFLANARRYRLLELMDDPAWWIYACKVVEGAAWRNFLAAFHSVFPECDEQAVRHDSLPARNDDSLLRGGKLAPVTTYDASESARLPASQPHLNNPVKIGNDWNTRLKIEEGNRDRSPASDPRALPRENGQPLFDATLDPELDLDVSQLDFNEAA